ncbi:ABC transporter ATP-binding protein [Oxalobacter vibrioformis]|uniref:Cell division ATP-binding protein FtsE n=1 Tax=Oxalobacter vibrioformis TaxID=933080 RepID=A0A9E9LX66_9BURK|nr:ABC transporter ATP-binding protein [Oxalobacter vibrioformis]NLC24536.1 ABC transporter ATP-binding protein [Oxalobacter sp.]WAW09250.1 ABC transporter ATP-binding protein [Oxalobacter vibrioformis]
MIEFFDVSRFYPGDITAVSNITFSIQPGEMVFLTGPSGAGKSTLLKMIAAIEKPDDGTLTVNGQDIANLRPAGIASLRQNLGLVLQQQALLEDRTILDNVMLPLIVTGTSRAEAEARANAALDKVDLADRAWFRPQTLSGGEQQRVAVARAIVNKPKIILADEPTTNLDRESAVKVIDAISFFQSAGVTCIIATHDGQLLERANRIIYLKQGRLIKSEQRVRPQTGRP